MSVLVGQITEVDKSPNFLVTDSSEQSVNGELFITAFIVGDIDRPSKSAGLTPQEGGTLTTTDVNKPQVRIVSRSRRFLKQ